MDNIMSFLQNKSHGWKCASTNARTLGCAFIFCIFHSKTQYIKQEYVILPDTCVLVLQTYRKRQGKAFFEAFPPHTSHISSISPPFMRIIFFLWDNKKITLWWTDEEERRSGGQNKYNQQEEIYIIVSRQNPQVTHDDGVMFATFCDLFGIFSSSPLFFNGSICRKPTTRQTGKPYTIFPVLTHMGKQKTLEPCVVYIRVVDIINIIDIIEIFLNLSRPFPHM